MSEHKISFQLNGERVQVTVPANLTLLKLLREEFDLIGTKAGCDAGECGACTILVDQQAVNSCLILAVEADGKELLTIEGLNDSTGLDPLQDAFIEHAALQCGFCTPGMIMAAKALLLKNPHPQTEDIKKALSGNLCRCTGYKKIVEAVLDAASRMQNL